jgi:hypothetical protein
MRAYGISYDTGFIRGGGSSREPFDPEVVRRELRIIRDDLHANVVAHRQRLLVAVVPWWIIMRAELAGRQ